MNGNNEKGGEGESEGDEDEEEYKIEAVIDAWTSIFKPLRIPYAFPLPGRVGRCVFERVSPI